MSVTIRAAREADLDLLTRMAVEGFPRDPQWTYRHPYRLDFPEDHYKYTRMRYADILADPSSYKLMVAEAVGSAPDNEAGAELVALSIWRMPGVEAGPQDEKCTCCSVICFPFWLACARHVSLAEQCQQLTQGYLLQISPVEIPAPVASRSGRLVATRQRPTALIASMQTNTLTCSNWLASLHSGGRARPRSSCGGA